jgi:hypothetical protein
MENRAKSLFYSVLYNIFHRRKILIDVLFRSLVFIMELRNQNLEILSPIRVSMQTYTNFVSEWVNQSFVQ